MNNPNLISVPSDLDEQVGPSDILTTCRSEFLWTEVDILVITPKVKAAALAASGRLVIIIIIYNYDYEVWLAMAGSIACVWSVCLSSVYDVTFQGRNCP